MELRRRLDPPTSGSAPCVATVGGFDGIHRGHLELVARTCRAARELAARSVVISFEPLPREYFAPEDPPGRLTSLRERCRLLAEAGVDEFCALRFDDRMRERTAEEFAGMLARGGVRRLVVGHDFRAGRGAEGDVAWFIARGRELGFDVEVVEPVCVDGERISSRRLRQALAAGDFALARSFLGRRYSMRGRVRGGDRLGRTLGFPTANLRLERRRSPLAGIFAVRVRGAVPERAVDGVASLGTRPTVGGTVPLLEAHLFDFSGDLYGREIEVQFIAHLRDERRFDVMEEMVAQMHEDARAARAALAADPD